MTPFVAPVDDILFSLEHVANASQLPGWDPDLVREIVQHFASFAEGEIAPLDSPGDVKGCRLEDGQVYLPDGFTEVYKTYVAQGWNGLSLPAEFDGQAMPAPVLGAISEIFAGACHALQMLVGLLPGAAHTISRFGSAEQVSTYLPLLCSGDWLTTMCLTEPGAGSDLSGVKTSAEIVNGHWRLTGDKIFISGGGQNLTPRILHLVLARTNPLTEGKPKLSLFLCRSHDANDHANAISVDRIEEKMGLHASPTCQLSFSGAKAELLGREGAGLKAMFTMMNDARMDVALQGVAHTARAHHISKSYAAERQQGRGPSGNTQAYIQHHPDIKRALKTQDSVALGGRAMCQVALVTQAKGDNPDLVDFLTPVCKFFCTEAGIEAADAGIQVLGGYGYLREYRIEQTWRDARVTSIYEGTNATQALTLANRLLRQNDGKAASAFEQFTKDAVNYFPNNQALADGLAIWQSMRQELQAAAKPEERAHAFMKVTGLLMLLVVWVRLNDKADQALNADRIKNLAEFVDRTVPNQLRYWADF